VVGRHELNRTVVVYRKRRNTEEVILPLLEEEEYLNLAIKIETEKLALLKSLNLSFGSITLESIADLVDGIDFFLLDHLGQCLVRHAEHLFEADRIDEAKQSFHVRGIRLELEIVPNVQRDTCLLVCLIPRGLSLEHSQTRLRKAVEIKIDGLGRYTSVVYDVPKLCSISNKDLLTALTRDVFVVGYNWMNEKVMKCIREASDDANRSLYEYVRTVVTDRRLLNGFVFSVLLDEKDFVVLDEAATRTAVSLATSSAWKLGRSPADIAVQAMTQVIPGIDSVIVDAVKSEKAMDFDLTLDNYYQADNSFSESMRAVWGSSVSCFPLMREGKVLLIALFPTEFKTELETILIVHRPRLEEIAKEKIGHMKKTLQTLMQIRPQSNWAGTIGEFSGAFAASFLKMMLHH
jgi:hypothetical protein